MALGYSQLMRVAEARNQIMASNSDIDDCLNTFQYVVNNLKDWADETTIGSNFKSELTTLIGNINNLESENKNLMNVIQDFKDRQSRINGSTSDIGLGSER